MALFLIVIMVAELILSIDIERRYAKQKRLIDSDIREMDLLINDCRVRLDAVEVLSDSVRKLNGVVKDLEQKQPKIEPKNRMNTRAFIAGWDADEPEPEDPVKKHIVDICVNGTCEQKQDLIDAMALQRTLLSQTQQCIEPWYPLQSGQFQSSAMLPLWYINKRLDDMHSGRR